MKIIFIGAGYVGLVSGILLSDFGYNVTCIDTNVEKINQLNKGILPIYEPNLNKYLHTNLNAKRLKFQHGYNETIENAAAIFITVNTPALPSGEADLSYIWNAVENLVSFLHNKSLIVIKSTVPPGTCSKIKQFLQAKNINCMIASNPEFLREGAAIDDFLNPDRIIIGTDDEKAIKILEKIYQPLTSKGINLVNTDLSTAELIKYGSNAFLAIKVAYINEMANLCEKIDADIEKLSLGLGLDSRIGPKFLKTGSGFGGSCFPKDILALSELAKINNIDCKIVDAAIGANNQRPKDMVNKISAIMQEELEGKKLAILGLTFKAGTDDLRSSPAIKIINLLQERGAIIYAYDPAGMGNARKNYPDIKCAESIEEACSQSDAIVIMTEWEEFKFIDFKYIYSIIKSPIIIDLRNIFDQHQLNEYGFKYFTIGRYNAG